MKTDNKYIYIYMYIKNERKNDWEIINETNLGFI